MGAVLNVIGFEGAAIRKRNPDPSLGGTDPWVQLIPNLARGSRCLASCCCRPCGLSPGCGWHCRPASRQRRRLLGGPDLVAVRDLAWVSVARVIG
jgi:hypothetical protein